MKIRAVAASALALALAAGLTGCNMISPQRTTMEYAASDGVNVDLGDVHARNVLLLTDGTGSQANLVFTAVNTSGDDAQINLNIDGTAVNIPLPYTPGNDVTQVGFGDRGPQLVQGNFTTGTTVDVEQHLEGDFPGGVADLHYRFTLDGALIDRLVIEP